jgi:hypothetical protein
MPKVERDKLVQIRVSRSERAAFARAAARVERSLSDWARRALRDAACEDQAAISGATK